MSSATSPSAPSSSSSPSYPLLDSSNPFSPLYTLDYKVPVHSLADSLAILRRAQNQPPSPAVPTAAACPPDKAAILAQLGRTSSSAPSESAQSQAGSSQGVATSDSASPAFSPPGYKLPAHSLRDSVKILNDRFGKKGKKTTEVLL